MTSKRKDSSDSIKASGYFGVIVGLIVITFGITASTLVSQIILTIVGLIVVFGSLVAIKRKTWNTVLEAFAALFNP